MTTQSLLDAVPVARVGRFRSPNVLAWVVAASPGKLAAAAFAVAVAFAFASQLVGVGYFESDVTLSLRAGSPLVLHLPLGFLTQLNYGPWFLFGAPVLLLFAAFAYRDTLHRADQHCGISFQTVSQGRAMVALSAATLAFFVWQNVGAELRDYDRLALGWVQAPMLARAVAKSPAVDLTRLAKRLDRLRINETYVMPSNIVTAVARLRMVPNAKLGVPFWTFVIAVKIAHAVWQALVVYLSALMLVWSVLVSRRITDEQIAENGISWFKRPVVYMLIVAVIANLFCIARFIANAAKGSFGAFDQYAGLLCLLPGVSALMGAAFVLFRAYQVAPQRVERFSSGPIKPVLLLWFVTVAAFAYLLSGYLSPAAQAQVEAVARPCSAIAEAIGHVLKVISGAA